MFTCPLAQIKAGEKCQIKQLLTDPIIQHRLQEMGFFKGNNIKIITKGFICEVCHIRFGICSNLAEKILVEKIDNI